MLFIEPLYQPVAEPVLYHDVYVIVVWIAGGYGRPYKAPKNVTSKHSPKQYFIRKFANSVIASPELKFDMNQERDYLSVTIPVHNYFRKISTNTKEAAYAERILACLQEEALTLTELAHKMGYKGITAKLRKTVAELQQSKRILQVIIGNAVKLTV